MKEKTINSMHSCGVPVYLHGTSCGWNNASVIIQNGETTIVGNLTGEEKKERWLQSTKTFSPPAPISKIGEDEVEKLAELFHDTYERLAPQFGYTTKEDTKTFDKDSPNGKLMIAVCEEIFKSRPEFKQAKQEGFSEEQMRKCFEAVENEIKSFMDATENQMLIKGLRESLLIVGRHKKSLHEQA